MTTYSASFAGVTTGGSGNAWTNTQNAYSIDSTYATSSTTPSTPSRYLRFTAWSSWTPIASDQYVNGIEVLVTLQPSYAGFSVQLVDRFDIAASGTRSVPAASGTGANVTLVLGGPGDLWGPLAITQADLRSGNFKLRLWCPTGPSQAINIDAVSVRVTHSVSAVSVDSPTLQFLSDLKVPSPTTQFPIDSLAYSMSLATPDVIGNTAVNLESLVLNQNLIDVWVGRGAPVMAPRLDLKQSQLDANARYGDYDTISNLAPSNGQIWDYFVSETDGPAWVTDNRGIVSDGTYANWQTTSGVGGYRVLNPFASLPGVDVNALVIGIQVNVERGCSNLYSYIGTYDQAAVLQRNYQDSSQDKKKTAEWSETKETVTYGSKHDLWHLPSGTQVKDLMEPGFGFRIDSFYKRDDGKPNGGEIQSSYIDNISFTLTYDESHTASPNNASAWIQQLQVPQTPTNVQPGTLAEEQSLKIPKTNTQVRPDRLAINQAHQVPLTKTQVKAPRLSLTEFVRIPKTNTTSQIPTYQYVQASLEPDLVTSLESQVSSFNLVYQDTKIDVIQDAQTLNLTLVSEVYLDQVLDVGTQDLTTVFSDTPIDQTVPVTTQVLNLTGQTGIDYTYDVGTQNLNLTYSEATPTGEALPMDLVFRMFDVNATSEYRVDSLTISTDQSNVYLDQGFKVDTQNLALDFTDPQNDTIFDVNSVNFNFGSTTVLKDTSYNLVTWLMNLSTTDTNQDQVLDVTTQNLNLTTTDTKYDLANDLMALEAMVEYPDVNASQDFDVTNYDYDSTWPETNVDYVFDAETMNLELTSKTAIDYIEDIVTQNLNLISPEVDVIGILAFWYVIEHFEEFKETQEDTFVLQVSESELTPIRIFDLEYIEVEDHVPEVIFVEE